MSRTIGIIALVTLTLVLPAAAQVDTDPPEQPSITVTGMAQKEVRATGLKVIFPVAGEAEEMTCSQAINRALAEEMRRDEGVYLLGEDVTLGGYMGVTVDLVDEFGAGRIKDTPISEYAIVGSSVGAAMMGLRPVAEILFSDFLTCCLDPIVNQAAKLRYMSGGQYSMPLVVRTPGGAGFGRFFI